MCPQGIDIVHQLEVAAEHFEDSRRPARASPQLEVRKREAREPWFAAREPSPKPCAASPKPYREPQPEAASPSP